MRRGDKPSTSGARLYMTGPEKLVHECFSIVKGVLPQSDFDDRNNNHAVCCSADGRNIKWGYMSDARVCDELGLPRPGVWAKMSVDECVQAITQYRKGDCNALRLEKVDPIQNRSCNTK